jgi:HK97 family phage prohead protease
MLHRESRIVTAEVRLAKRADGKTVIRGHSALFNVFSEMMWGFREQIAPGAFSDCIGPDADVCSLFNHEPDNVLGRTPRTLTLSEDNTGLMMETDPADTQCARDCVTLIDRGDVKGQSFSFSMDYDDNAAETWDYEGDIVTRTIRKISRLWDVGPVTFPAYPTTDVAVAQRMLVPDDLKRRAESFRKSIEKEGRSVDFARRRLAFTGR